MGDMADYQIEHMYDPWDGIGECQEDYCDLCDGFIDYEKGCPCGQYLPKEKKDEIQSNNEVS
jgi:hypothetical protein